jgi:hypothetical protein
MNAFTTDILTEMTSTVQTFVVAFVQSYWPLILGIGAIIAIGSYLFRLGRGGGK